MERPTYQVTASIDADGKPMLNIARYKREMNFADAQSQYDFDDNINVTAIVQVHNNGLFVIALPNNNEISKEETDQIFTTNE